MNLNTDTSARPSYGPANNAPSSSQQSTGLAPEKINTSSPAKSKPIPIPIVRPGTARMVNPTGVPRLNNSSAKPIPVSMLTRALQGEDDNPENYNSDLEIRAKVTIIDLRANASPPTDNG